MRKKSVKKKINQLLEKESNLNSHIKKNTKDLETYMSKINSHLEALKNKK